MKNSITLILAIFFTSLTSAQSFRALTRQGNRAYDKQDYATATINSIKALQDNPKFNKSIELFENSIVRVNKFYEIKINQLESSSIPFDEIKDVLATRQIIQNLQLLIDVQNELMFFPENVKLSKKDLVKQNTKDYQLKMNEAKSRLVEYNSLAAELIYNESIKLIENAQSKSDFITAYKSLDRINSYVSGYKNVGQLMDECKTKGTYRVALLDPANSSGNSDTRFNVINTIMNKTRSNLGANQFVTLVNIQNSSIGYYSNNYNGISADLVIKITFNNWNYGSEVVKRENYSNTVTNKKKDGTEESFSVSGVRIEKNFYANYDLIVEAILTSDNTILYSEPLNLNYSYTDNYLIGKGSGKANKSGSRLVDSEPTPSIIPKDAFTDSFQQQTMNLFSKWFN